MPDARNAQVPWRLPSGSTRLRWLRRLRGLKQAALADLMGVAQTTISRWERGELELGPDVLMRLLAILADPTGPADRALVDLVRGSRRSVHLVTDVDHRLLAASPKRLAEWERDESDLVGRSLWRFATPEIEVAETILVERGWWDVAYPEALELTLKEGFRGLPIKAGPMRWDRLYLADATPVRLCTSLEAAGTIDA